MRHPGGFRKTSGYVLLNKSAFAVAFIWRLSRTSGGFSAERKSCSNSPLRLFGPALYPGPQPFPTCCPSFSPSYTTGHHAAGKLRECPLQIHLPFSLNALPTFHPLPGLTGRTVFKLDCPHLGHRRMFTPNAFSTTSATDFFSLFASGGGST